MLTYIFHQLHSLACTPMCINGVIDQAVVDFTAGLMDILMELGFGQALPGDRWRNCSARLTVLAKALGESAPPSWVDTPARDQVEVHMSDVLLGMESDSEDEDDPSLSMPLDLASTHQFQPSTSSLPGPSTSTLVITPLQPIATISTSNITSPQGLPAGNVGTAAQIQHLQRELKRAR
jgi:hypothetical protein